MFARRSNAGVGITPPKVLGAAKPTSSVIIRSTLGAPFGGTIRAGQACWDRAALGLISPSNFCGGLGRFLPSMAVVASWAHGRQDRCCAVAEPAAAAVAAAPMPNWRRVKPLPAMVHLAGLRMNMQRLPGSLGTAQAGHLSGQILICGCSEARGTYARLRGSWHAQ